MNPVPASGYDEQEGMLARPRSRSADADTARHTPAGRAVRQLTGLGLAAEP